MSVIHATEESFANEIADGLVWCGPCKMIAPVLDELAQEVEKTAKVVKVNVDHCKEVAAEYQVMSIPTLILFKDGQVDKKAIGFHSIEELRKIIA